MQDIDSASGSKTPDLSLASYLISCCGYALRGVEGQPGGRRWFILDRPIDDTVAAAFFNSREKHLLDTFRSLKIAILTG